MPWQQPHPMPAPVPPKRSNKWKWVLGALALLVVIGVTVAVTVTVLGRGDKEADGSPPSAAPVKDNGGNKSNSDIASANDTGPVAIITEDPTCAAQAYLHHACGANKEWLGKARSVYTGYGVDPRNAGPIRGGGKSDEECRRPVGTVSKVDATPSRARAI